MSAPVEKPVTLSPQRGSIGSYDDQVSESRTSLASSGRYKEEIKTEWRRGTKVRSVESRAKEDARSANSLLSDRSERSRGSTASSQYNEEDRNNRSRASSLEKHQRNQADVLIATSTPHKASWPLSPIKRPPNLEVIRVIR